MSVLTTFYRFLLRGGPTEKASIEVAKARELLLDTTTKELRVGDGVTPGGLPLTVGRPPADCVLESATRLGLVGNMPLTTTALSAADWAALPVGWSGIISADVAVASGLPAADVYHLHKISSRDVFGGAAYQAIGYLTPALHVGVAATSADLPAWSKVALSASTVGHSLLSLSTPGSAKIPRINADGSATLIDVPIGGGTDFSPDALSGLKAWFKADSGVLKTDGSTAGDGDSVAIWQDQSGGGFHLAQVDGAKQPVLTPSAIGAHAALRFDSVSRYMLTTTGPSLNLSELTIAVVFRSLSSELYQRLVVLGPTGSTGSDYDSSNRCMVSLADRDNCADFFANSNSVTIAGSRPPPPGVLIARISRGRMVLIADDVVRSSVASVPSLSTSVGLLLGAYYTSGSIDPSYGLDGYIAELTLFSRALSDFECGQLSNYLARWLR